MPVIEDTAGPQFTAVGRRQLYPVQLTYLVFTVSERPALADTRCVAGRMPASEIQHSPVSAAAAAALCCSRPTADGRDEYTDQRQTVTSRYNGE